MPFALPSGLLNRFTVAQFNRLVYWAHWRKHRRDRVSVATFFYPLDRVPGWNLAYGSRGVTQHQCVIPQEQGVEGIRELIDVLAAAGSCSFLTVVKDCGPQGDGILSFPRPGMSVALDIPIRDDTQAVIDRLNRCVLQRGGRVYLAKDGMTRSEDFRQMEPRLAAFLETKRRWDPHNQLRSAQSERLFGEWAVNEVTAAATETADPGPSEASPQPVALQPSPSSTGSSQ
jgi:FAD/FMN-containing dehydrogenase